MLGFWALSPVSGLWWSLSQVVSLGRWSLEHIRCSGPFSSPGRPLPAGAPPQRRLYPFWLLCFRLPISRIRPEYRWVAVRCALFPAMPSYSATWGAQSRRSASWSGPHASRKLDFRWLGQGVICQRVSYRDVQYWGRPEGWAATSRARSKTTSNDRFGSSSWIARPTIRWPYVPNEWLLWFWHPSHGPFETCELSSDFQAG